MNDETEKRERGMKEWEPLIISTTSTKGKDEAELLRNWLTREGFDNPSLQLFFIEEMFYRASKLGKHTDAEINNTIYKTEKKGKVNIDKEIFDVNYEIEGWSKKLTISRYNNKLVIEHKQSTDLSDNGVVEYKLEGNNREYLDILKEFLDEKADKQGLKVSPKKVTEHILEETGGFEPDSYKYSNKLHSSYSPKFIGSMHGKETQEDDKEQNYRVVKIKTREPVRCVPCVDPEKKKYKTCKECLEYFSGLEEPTKGDMLGPYWKNRK